jgi:hypothetical protein
MLGAAVLGVAAAIALIPWRVVAQTPTASTKPQTIASAKPTVAVQQSSDRATQERLQALEQQVKRLEALIREERRHSADETDRARAAERMATAQRSRAEQEAEIARIMASKQDKAARSMRRKEEELARSKMLRDLGDVKAAESAARDAARLKVLEERGYVSKSDADRAAHESELKAQYLERAAQERHARAERYANEKSQYQERAAKEKRALAEHYSDLKTLNQRTQGSKERALAAELERLQAQLKERDAQIEQLRKQLERSKSKSPPSADNTRRIDVSLLMYRDRLESDLEDAERNLQSLLGRYTVDHPAIKKQQENIRSLRNKINRTEKPVQ